MVLTGMKLIFENVIRLVGTSKERLERGQGINSSFTKHSQTGIGIF